MLLTETADCIVKKASFSLVVFQTLACDWLLPRSIMNNFNIEAYLLMSLFSIKILELKKKQRR